jgi:N-acetylglucosamine kinase-like BadF-type ATPase
LIAIDEDGKVLFTTQTLGLNPEVLIMKSLIVSMIALIFCKIKKNTTHLFFFYGAGWTDKMKISQIFQNYFPNAIISVEEDTYAAVYATTPKGQQAIVVSILGTGSNCSYFDGKELHQKYNHWLYRYG